MKKAQEYQRWEPGVDALWINFLFDGDPREKDPDTKCFPIYVIEKAQRRTYLHPRRCLMKLTGFRQGEVRRKGGKLAPKPLNLDCMPLESPLTAEDLAELTTEKFNRSSLVLIVSHERRRVYLCTERSFEAYEAAFK